MLEKTKVVSSGLALTMVLGCIAFAFSNYAEINLVIIAFATIILIGMNAVSIYSNSRKRNVMFYLALAVITVGTFIVLPYDPVISLCMFAAFSVEYTILLEKPYMEWTNSYATEACFWILASLGIFVFGTVIMDYCLDRVYALIFTAISAFAIICGSTLYVKAIPSANEDLN